MIPCQKIISLLLWLLLFAPLRVTSDFLTQPLVKWTYKLPSDLGSPLQGNAVTPSKDANYVFITTSNGNLHILAPANISQTARNGGAGKKGDGVALTFVPPMTSSTTSVSCQSGVLLIEDGEQDKHSFAVYAVVETPDQTTSASVQSRVLAVNWDGKLRWQVQVPGVIVGTPVRGMVEQDRLYVVHNANNVGQISVVLMSSTLNSTRVVATQSSPTNDTTFGPIAVQAIDPSQQQQQGGGGSSGNATGMIDVVVAAANTSGGDTTQGGLYVFLPSSSYDALQGRGNDAYTIQSVSSTAASSIVAPLVTSQLEVFLVEEGSVISAWVGAQSLLPQLSNLLAGTGTELLPRWTIIPPTNSDDPTAPISVRPIMNSASSIVFVATPDGEVLALDSTQGQVSWSDYPGVAIAAPVITENDSQNPVVYFISNDTVLQYDVNSGQRLWQMSACQQQSGDGACAVEADFSVMDSGNVLLYATTDGALTALSVANFTTLAPTYLPTMAPSPKPSLAPSTSKPSQRPTSPPSLRPTAKPTKSITLSVAPTTPTPIPTSTPTINSAPIATNNTESISNSSLNSKSSGDLPVILGAVCGGLAAAIVGVFLLLKRNRKSPGQRFKEETDSVCDEATREVEKDLRGVAVDYNSDDDDDTETEADESNSATPTKATRRKRSNSRNGSPATPLTLSSIAESPNEFDDGRSLKTDEELGSDAGFEMSIAEKDKDVVSDNVVKNLADSFAVAASTQTETGPSKDVENSSVFPPIVEDKRTELPTRNDSPDDAKTYQADTRMDQDDRTIATGDPGSIAPRTSIESARSDHVRRPASPLQSDLVSVDSSLYLDDLSRIASMKSMDTTDRPNDEAVADNKRQSGSFDGISAPGSHYLNSGQRAVTVGASIQQAVTPTRSNTEPSARSPYVVSSLRPARVDAAYPRRTDPVRVRSAGDDSSRFTAEGYVKDAERASFAPVGASPSSIAIGRARKKGSTWNSFLDELSKVEQSFFGPPRAGFVTRAASPPPAQDRPDSSSQARAGFVTRASSPPPFSAQDSPPPSPPPPPRLHSSSSDSVPFHVPSLMDDDEYSNGNSANSERALPPKSRLL